MAATSWSPAEDNAALTLPTSEFLARFPDRTRHQLRHRRALLQRDGAPDPRDAGRERTGSPNPAAVERIARNSGQIVGESKADIIRRAELRELQQLAKDQARFELLMDALNAGMARMPSFDAPILSPVSLSHTEETAVLVISDVHVGKWVNPETVGDNFGYSTPEFRRRLARLQASLHEIVEIHRRAYPIRTLYVLMLGDLVDGSDMREGQKVRIDQTVGAQTLTLVSEMVPFLGYLGQLFEQVNVLVVGGNHGRLGKPGVNTPLDNWDVMAGHMMAVAMQDVANVSFRISHRPYEIATIGGLRVHLSHGEAIRGGGGFAGIPAYGVARSAARDVQLHQSLFDLMVMAHFHVCQDLELNGIPILMNGCWDGGDDFTVNQLKAASTPAQWFFGIHPKRGLTWRYKLQVSDAKRPASPAFVFGEAGAA